MISLLAALTLSLSASPEPALAGQPAPDAVRYEQSTPRRDFLVFWTIGSTGHLVHRSVDPMGRGVEGTLELGADRFAQVIALLAPLDRLPEPCETRGEPWSSQTTVSWTRGGSTSSLTLGDGCPNARSVEDLGAARQADRLIQGWIAEAAR
ncbi:hypothetical protein [Brevundimonas sp. FT23028]|uniref:hypothetical protein n=1 Tax=Brevundimonas sp. FT23028 TaxID=3393748 RepID=UPI003B588FB1